GCLLGGARNPDPLARVVQDRDVQLRLLDHGSESLGQRLAQFGWGQSSRLDLAQIGIEEGAIALDQAAGKVALLLRAGGDRKFRVIPDSDVEDITGADAVRLGLVIEQRLWHLLA